ncbi:MAG: flagellar assembly protein FliX [Alphaproteobacteria bacterium]
MISPLRISRPSATRPSKAAPAATSAAGFSASLASEPTRAKGALGVAALASVDAIVALQSVENAATGRSRAMQRGVKILDSLDDLRLEILDGRVAPARLTHILSLVENQRENSGDHLLDDLLDGIDLRARVELAKLGR